MDSRRSAKRPRLDTEKVVSLYHHNHRRSDSPSYSGSHDEEASYTDYSYDSPLPTKPILSLSPDHSNSTNGNRNRSIFTNPARRKRRFNFSRAGPRSVVRWLCWGVLVCLVLFILVLFRAHLVSNIIMRPVEPIMPSRRPPPPPAWESFPFLRRFYGGVRTLVPRGENVAEWPVEEGEGEEQKGEEQQEKGKRTNVNATIPMTSSAFDPYPNYTSPEYVAKYGTKVDCFLEVNGTTVEIPQVHRFDGVPLGFPDAAMGSNEMLGIRDDVCFDRFGRLGPYGFGYGKRAGGSGAGLEGDREGIDNVWEDAPPVDYRGVSWADAQRRCIAANKHRFAEGPEPPVNHFTPRLESEAEVDEPANVTVGTDKLPKTAVIVRTWTGYNYKAETILYLRSLIAELALHTGGEYQVFFLVHVKDENLPIWSDPATYARVLRESLPAEFAAMGILWSERQMALIYPGLEESWARNLPVHGVYRSTFMPVQYFAHTHPEFDYYWNWEMDLRYTGHWYHFFSRVAAWAAEQPRKGLWERNARFYVPDVHGSWDDFRHLVRVQTERGTNSPSNNVYAPATDGKPTLDSLRPPPQQGDVPVWGPLRPPSESDILPVPDEGIPPHSYASDKHTWGVSEPADLIVFNPLYDPQGTTWLLRDDVTGYNTTENQKIPRRAAIITASRLSRKLLHTMHAETSQKRHTMFSEMWPASVALHHGYKAVYVPHSVYIDRAWPTGYLESVFNAGRNGASGGGRMSVFGDHEHNFRGTTWFYSAGHSENLWKRWLGYKVNNDGGEEEEVLGEGRMCLPAMMLHPVKEVDMVMESGDGQENKLG